MWGGGGIQCTNCGTDAGIAIASWIQRETCMGEALPMAITMLVYAYDNIILGMNSCKELISILD